MEPPDSLRTFRRSFYECFHRRRDALFELADAILTADGTAPSPAHLSLQPLHRRGWGSLYAALWRGDASTTKPYGSSWPAIRSLAPKGSPPSTPWTRACGLGAMRKPGLSAATTTIRRGTQPGSPSSQDGPTSSSHSLASCARVGPLSWTCGASYPLKTPTRSPPSRSRLCLVGSKKERPSPC